MIDAGGDIPGRALIPLHVGVVGEEFAVLVEGDVELVAEAESEELDGLAVGIHAADVATGGIFAFGVAAGVPHAGSRWSSSQRTGRDLFRLVGRSV